MEVYRWGGGEGEVQSGTDTQEWKREEKRRVRKWEMKDAGRRT